MIPDLDDVVDFEQLDLERCWARRLRLRSLQIAD